MGKTELAKSLAMFLFGDEEVTRLSPDKRGIGLVFQNYALYPHMTIYKNVAFPLTNLRVEEDKVYKMQFGATIGTYSGPGAFAIGYFHKKPDPNLLSTPQI